MYLYWNIYCCTEKHICVLEYILLYWNIYFCTGIHIVVLECILLYWKTYCCTGTYIVVLEYIFLYCPCGPPYKCEEFSKMAAASLFVSLLQAYFSWIDKLANGLSFG